MENAKAEGMKNPHGARRLPAQNRVRKGVLTCSLKTAKPELVADHDLISAGGIGIPLYSKTQAVVDEGTLF